MPRPSRFADEAGYSLIEVLVAALILTGAILPMASMFDMALDATRSGGDLDTAHGIAHAALEDVQALDYGEVISRYSPSTETSCPDNPYGTNFDCRIRVESVGEDLDPIAAPGSRMMVTATVEWDGHDYAASQFITASSP